MDRGTIAVISWTRHSWLPVASVYNAHEVDLGHEETTRARFDQWQEYLVGVAGAPWIIHRWGLESRTRASGPSMGPGQARILDLGTAKQRQAPSLGLDVLVSVRERRLGARKR